MLEELLTPVINAQIVFELEQEELARYYDNDADAIDFQDHIVKLLNT